MPDNKLNELIEEYHNIVTDMYPSTYMKQNDVEGKARQAILDYVVEERNRAVDEGIRYALHNREEN